MFPQVVRTPWHFNAGVGAVPSIASFRTRVGAWPQAMSGLGPNSEHVPKIRIAIYSA